MDAPQDYHINSDKIMNTFHDQYRGVPGLPMPVSLLEKYGTKRRLIRGNAAYHSLFKHYLFCRDAFAGDVSQLATETWLELGPEMDGLDKTGGDPSVVSTTNMEFYLAPKRTLMLETLSCSLSADIVIATKWRLHGSKAVAT